jgi:hypothetical protein
MSNWTVCQIGRSGAATLMALCGLLALWSIASTCQASIQIGDYTSLMSADSIVATLNDSTLISENGVGTSSNRKTQRPMLMPERHDGEDSLLTQALLGGANTSGTGTTSGNGAGFGGVDLVAQFDSTLQVADPPTGAVCVASFLRIPDPPGHDLLRPPICDASV